MSVHVRLASSHRVIVLYGNAAVPIRTKEFFMTVIAKTAAKISGAVMVIGGGVAGVQTALDLTELGYKVYLVELREGKCRHSSNRDGMYCLSIS